MGKPNSYASSVAKGHNAKRVYQSQPTAYSTASCPCPSSYPYGPYNYINGVTTCLNSSGATYCINNYDCNIGAPCQPVS